MNKKQNSVSITLWVNRGVALLMAVLIVVLPRLLEHYGSLWSLPQVNQIVLLVAFYGCLAAIMPALWNIEILLRNIRGQRVFIIENVIRIRRLRLTCTVVSLICLAAALAYWPLFFLCVIMAFLAFILSVVVDVMYAAVTIREENDLTI